MSYRRSFSKVIEVHYSGSVSYPASQNGGYAHYSGTASELVTVDIKVDTDDFDDSIESAKNHVDGLTGSVVATEAAQVQSIHDNAQKVGSTIVKGFFKTVQSEISQQIAELSSNIEATMIHLRKLAQRCVDKQKQMSTDYQRITSRYTKIFTDLNQELENRIFSLDEPAFKFQRQAAVLQEATTSANGGSTVAIAGAETGSLHARITASMAKRDALAAIRQANTFLYKQQGVERLLRQSLLDEHAEGLRYTPAIFIENRSSATTTDATLLTSPMLGEATRRTIDSQIRDLNWNGHVADEADERVRYYYNMAIANEAPADGSKHSERVRAYLSSLFKLGNTAVPEV